MLPYHIHIEACLPRNLFDSVRFKQAFILSIMRSSFDSLPYAVKTQTRSQRNSSPRFLKAVRGLVHRASTGSISTRHPGSADSNTDALFRSASDSTEGSSSQILWKRRGNTPGMDDYLTLSQLEAAWDTQDIYLGYVNVPQEAIQYTFQEAVEAPVIVKHNIINRPSEGLPPPPPPKDAVPRFRFHNDPNVINGSVHPALRPQPYISEDDS